MRRFARSLFCLVLLLAGGGELRAADAPGLWSLQPVSRPDPPATGEGRSANPIDRFVFDRLRKQNLSPAAEADKYTLVRRLTFDLTGLPPTPQEIRAFVADHSPDAYEKLVDRLLASPHYGEHWGRHWLDVARYVQGRITFPGVKNTSGDQAYRDYVVRAFNIDKPYDRFVTEQLAGDLLPPSGDRAQEFDRITAPAFLSIGAWFDQCTDPNRLRLEMVDDMINVTGQGLLGMTISCARCHDHKFDPIPTRDYYALAGIFRSTRIVGDFSEYWRDGRQRLLRPRAMPAEVAANDAILRRAAGLKAERWNLLSDAHERLIARWQADEPRYRSAAREMPAPYVRRFAAENFDGQHNLRIAQLSLNGQSVDVIETLTPTDQWVKYKLDVPADGKYRLEALYSTAASSPVTVTVNGQVVARDALGEPTGGFELKYQRWATVCSCDFNSGINFIRLDLKQGDFPRLDRFRLVSADDGSAAKIASLATRRGLDPRALGAFVKDPAQPWPTVADTVDFLDPDAAGRVRALDEQIDRLEKPLATYPLIVSVTDESKPADMPVHVRGDTYAVSPDPNPRGVPHLFDDLVPRPAIPESSSGRLELARWITDQRNPLTARVMVNRIWAWHFGRGIVATPSDFGTRGSPPTNPELLDWLAGEFMDSGWSVKHIQRLIVTSDVYRMSGRVAGDATAGDATARDALARDPDDQFLSHFPSRRLEVEALYDAMASTTNIIVRQPAGEPLDVEKDKNRAMYVLACNRSPKGLGGEVRKMFDLFDYDSSGAPIAQRPQSTTAAQALFWLNSPLVEHFADRFADRLLKMDRLDDRHRVEMAYLLALGRPPTERESELSLELINSQGSDRQAAWKALCSALYASAEFHYLR